MSEMFVVSTTAIPNKNERKTVEVDAKELKALLDAGLVRICPEYDGDIPGTSIHSREDILTFIATLWITAKAVNVEDNK